jgi:ubiquitin-protein ligase
MQADNKVPVPDKRQTAIMMAQYKKATAEPNEFIKFVMSLDNACVWYIRISNFSGDENEFVGGQYDCRMVAPIDFPFNPPSFYFLTHNGLYDVETKVCINIGEYHKDEYRAALGMAGFANQLVSGLIGWRSMGGGINVLSTSATKKKQLAEVSAAYNKEHHPAICEMIEGAFAGYSARWDRTKIPADLAARLGLNVPAAVPVPAAIPALAPTSNAGAATASASVDTAVTDTTKTK